MNDKSSKWIIGPLIAILLFLLGLGYADVNRRIIVIEEALPILYRIEEKVNNIEKILESHIE